MTTDEDILKLLHAADKSALGVLYERHRKEFINSLRKSYRMDEEQAVDIFIESLLKLEQEVRQGKFKESYDGGIPGWLYTVGKNKFLERKKNQIRENQLLHTLKPEEYDYPQPFPEDDEATVRQLYAGLKELGDPCSRLLTLFYLEGQSFRQILEIMLNYSNTDVLKKEKWRCLNRLRKIIFRSAPNQT